MIQKLEKLVDLAVEALTMYIRMNTIERAPVKEAPGTAAAPAPRGRPKKVAAAPVAEPEAESPFGIAGAAASSEKLSAEDAVEAARRGQEVMGLFIRRYLKAVPSGLERAKGVIEKELGKPRNGEAAWKLEHFTPHDWLKLTPIFEGELEKVA